MEHITAKQFSEQIRQKLNQKMCIRDRVLDKTGTITEGRPRVTDLICYRAADETALLSVAAALEKPSEHPLASAILEKAEEMGTEIRATEQFEAISGYGISAVLDGKPYYAGNLRCV